MKLSQDLAWRGLIHQTTLKDPKELDSPRTFYLGVDPSSDSMTIGNLAVILLVRRFIEAGYKAVVLVGGATGMIGDPKDTSERTLKTAKEIEHNKTAIASQYKQLLGELPFEVVDNYDWFKDIPYITFLREIGKNFSMTQLLDRDFIQKRIGKDGAGISYAEFSYSLIQGYDFLHLHREKKVSLQIGASDQWGNMLSGVQLVRQIEDSEVHVLTMPLIIDAATGVKFGKSEAGAVWLSEVKTSVYNFYQFWLNSSDDALEKFFKVYTFLSPEEITQILHDHQADPASRKAQQRLAHEITRFVHGEDKAHSAATITKLLFNEIANQTLTDADKTLLYAAIPKAASGQSMVDALIEGGVVSSKGEARRFIAAGAITMQGYKVSEHDITVSGTIIKKGKNTFLAII